MEEQDFDILSFLQNVFENPQQSVDELVSVVQEGIGNQLPEPPARELPEIDFTPLQNLSSLVGDGLSNLRENLPQPAPQPEFGEILEAAQGAAQSILQPVIDFGQNFDLPEFIDGFSINPGELLI